MPGLYDDSLTGPTATPGLWDWLQHPLNSYGQWAAANATSPGMRLNGAPPNVGAFTPAGQPAALPTQAPSQDPATNPFQSFAGQGQYAPAAPPPAASQPAPGFGPDGQPLAAGAWDASRVTSPAGAQQTPNTDPFQAFAGQSAQELPNARYSRLTGFLGGPESNNDPNAVNPKSGAAGQYQFLPSTWSNFLQSPANTGGWGAKDITNPEAQKAAAGWNFAQNDGVISKALGRPASDEELLAAHLLGGAGVAALAANPTGNAYQTYSKVGNADQAFANNGKILNKDQTGQDAIASAASFYRTGAGQGRTQVAGPGAPTGDQPAAQPVPQQAAQQSAPPAVDPVAAAQAKAAADLANYKPTPDPYPNAATLPQNSRLLAVASGLLSGPTFGEGLGKGLQNMLSVDASNRQGQMQMNQLNRQQNQQMMELQRLGIMTGFNGVKLGQGERKLDIQGQNANTSSGRLQLATSNADPNHAGAVAGAKLASGNAQKDIEAVQNSRMSDEQAAQDSAQAQQQILQHPELMGTTLAARASRVLAETGIAGDPNALSALQKMTADARNTYLSGLTGGHVGGIRSNAELQNLSKAVADVNTNAAAAQWIIKMQQNQINARQGWREELAQRQQEDPASVQGQNYFRQKDQFMKDWLQRNPLPDYAPSSQSAATPGTTASNATKGASGTTSTGISYSVN